VTSTSPTLACDGAGAESSITDGHTHAVCIPGSDIASVRAGSTGGAYTTTVTDGHSHGLVLDPPELETLHDGPTVTATTSVAQDHTHTFVLQRATPSTLPSAHPP
jgi:hypothetical protein